MTNHTPAPWVAYGLIIRGEDGSEDQIAEVSSWGGSEEAKANARLIAAAPEILEALESMLRFNHHEVGTIGWIGQSKARAARAKATGEQND